VINMEIAKWVKRLAAMEALPSGFIPCHCANIAIEAFSLAL